MESCPACKRPATGRFCSQCGARLGAATHCRSCSAELLPAARFCNSCGAEADLTAEAAAPVRAGAPAIGANAPWLVAIAAVLLLILAVTVPRFRGQSEAPAASAAPFQTAPADPRAIDLSAMTPREAADQLFERIMRAASAGDSAQARAFAPMALSAYERVDELDADARYHIAVLHLLVDNPVAARAQAETILSADPAHLFGLFTAAQAARQAGETADATRLFGQFLEHYPTEIIRDLPEYAAHAPAFPQMRAEAQSFLAAAE